MEWEKAGGERGGALLLHAPLRPQIHLLAVAILVDPLADRVALVRGLDFLGPVAAVGKNSSEVVCAGNQDIRGVRRDDEFQRKECHHAEWHAGGQAAGAVVDEIALAAFSLVGKARFEDGLILGRKWRLLSAPPRLGLVEGRLPAEPTDREPRPGSLPVRVFRQLLC